MSKIDELRKRRSAIMLEYDQLGEDMDRTGDRIEKLIKFAENTPEYLAELDRLFTEKTSLDLHEFTIICVVAGLQVLRQHFLTPFVERLGDQECAQNTFGHAEEHSNRTQWYYNPTLEEIISNPVPFDVNIGSNGVLAGGGHFGHRGRTLGHDPLLGLIFGTANIATSTVTTSSFESYHVRTGNGRDIFAENADTIKILRHTLDKLFNQGIEGKTKVGAAFVKEIIHLRSDADSTNGLPLPFGTLNSVFSSALAQYGIDFSNTLVVMKQVALARLINAIAAMYHYMFFDGSISEDLYRVKTKKIICYSNAVASTINIAEVGFTGNLNLLDIGGITNTLFELVTSAKFIKKVKRDFIFGEYDKSLEAL